MDIGIPLSSVSYVYLPNWTNQSLIYTNLDVGFMRPGLFFKKLIQRSPVGSTSNLRGHISQARPAGCPRRVPGSTFEGRRCSATAQKHVACLPVTAENRGHRWQHCGGTGNAGGVATGAEQGGNDVGGRSILVYHLGDPRCFDLFFRKARFGFFWLMAQNRLRRKCRILYLYVAIGKLSFTCWKWKCFGCSDVSPVG